MVERPDDDASAAEIAEWMERDFWEGVEESIRNVVEDAENND
jgi:hypothetical protein